VVRPTIGEHSFVSLNEIKREVEFFPNDAGETELCFWTRGSLKFYGYRRDVVGVRSKSVAFWLRIPNSPIFRKTL
jgi:hypothetical protein